jgi:hypothetical protein
MRDQIMVDILKIDENDFKRAISPIEAKNLIYVNTLGLDRNLLHGLDISFKGHPVITYRLREQINVDTTFESEDFVFERDSGSGRSLPKINFIGNNPTLKSKFDHFDRNLVYFSKLGEN